MIGRATRWTIATAVFLTACGFNGSTPKLPGAATPTVAPPPAGRGPNKFYETCVYFGTDRHRTTDDDPYAMFDADRGALTLGHCTVSIPADHEAGHLETHAWWKLEFSDDPRKHVTLRAAQTMAHDDFVNELRTRVSASTSKSAFIFIHGYHTTFSEAARRTAQLAFDLNFDGAPIFYSWPSRGELVAYQADQNDAEWTGPDLHKFLSLVAAESGATEASLIVHSMGNRALASALDDLAQNPGIGSMKLREIVLAAPDLDRDVFANQIVPRFPATDARVTLYASTHDEALLASKKINAHARAGDAVGGVLVVKGVESIDVSDVDNSFLGHSYFGEATSVLSDIHAIIVDHKPPGGRPALVPVAGPSAGTYWRLTAPLPH